MIKWFINVILSVSTGGVWPALCWVGRRFKSQDGKDSFFKRVMALVASHAIFSVLIGSVSVWGLFKGVGYVMAFMLWAFLGYTVEPPTGEQEQAKSFFARTQDAAAEQFTKLKEKMASEFEERKRSFEEATTKLKDDLKREKVEALDKLNKEKEEKEAALRKVIQDHDLADAKTKAQAELERLAREAKENADNMRRSAREEAEKLRRETADLLTKERAEAAEKARQLAEKAKEKAGSYAAGALVSTLSNIPGIAPEKPGGPYIPAWHNGVNQLFDTITGKPEPSLPGVKGDYCVLFCPDINCFKGVIYWDATVGKPDPKSIKCYGGHVIDFKSNTKVRMSRQEYEARIESAKRGVKYGGRTWLVEENNYILQYQAAHPPQSSPYNLGQSPSSIKLPIILPK